MRSRPPAGGWRAFVAQLRAGRPADVLVTADVQSMNEARKLTGESRTIAHNSMTIAVAPGNPKHIQGVADLADPRLRVVLGAPTTPAGRYAQQVFTKAGGTVVPKSEGIDVRSVLTPVLTGE